MTDNETETRLNGLVRAYHANPGSRNVILSHLVKLYQGEAENICHLRKISPSRLEKDSEIVYAILTVFEDTKGRTNFEGQEPYDFDGVIKKYLDRGLKNLAGIKRNHIDITTVSILDESNNPEEIYEAKEQIELIKAFVKAREGQLTLEMFLMFYMDGMTMVEIGDLFGVSDRSISVKLHRVMDQVQRYMKRITK